MVQHLAILVEAVKVDIKIVVRSTLDDRPLLAKPHLFACSVVPRIAEPVAPIPNLSQGQHLRDASRTGAPSRRPTGVPFVSREVAQGSDRGWTLGWSPS